jgi:hypothetical protein
VTVWYCWDIGFPPEALIEMFKTIKFLLDHGNLRVVVSYYSDWALEGEALHGKVVLAGQLSVNNAVSFLQRHFQPARLLLDPNNPD